MPTREKNYMRSYYNYPGIPTDYWVQESVDRTSFWYNTPNYSSIPRDALPVNPYTDERRHFTQPQIVEQITVEKPSGNITYSRDAWRLQDLNTLYIGMAAETYANARSHESLVNEVTLKALTKVSDSKVNLAVTLAEAHKTSDLILGKANAIYKAYRSFRRGDLAGVAKHLNISPRRVHKTWLEYKYGWMPLLMDVKGAAEFFAQQQVGRPIRFVTIARVSDDAVYNNNEVVPWPSGGSFNSYERNIHRVYTVKLWCELSNPHLSQLQQLGLTNPALVAWELIPFSFCFDWLCSVGDYLTGLTALNGVTLRRAMLSWISEGEFIRQAYRNSQDSQYSTISSFGSRVVLKGRAYQRQALVVDPLSLYPPVHNPFTSVSRLVTSLALLRAQSRR